MGTKHKYDFHCSKRDSKTIWQALGKVRHKGAIVDFAASIGQTCGITIVSILVLRPQEWAEARLWPFGCGRTGTISAGKFGRPAGPQTIVFALQRANIAPCNQDGFGLPALLVQSSPSTGACAKPAFKEGVKQTKMIKSALFSHIDDLNFSVTQQGHDLE